MHYWHFTFFVNVPSSGAQRKDNAVIASVEPFFPVGNVYIYFLEEFGEGVEIEILNAFEISWLDYDRMSATMGIGDENN